MYVYHLCPSLWWMDSAEFVFHSSVLGIPHPTGYPLYIQLGKLFTLLPGLEDPYALNLFSALMASATVVLLYRIILDLTEKALVSAVSALLFAFSFTFWSQAEIAEVYTLHTFFLTILIYLLMMLRRTGDRRVLYLLSFTFGLSLTHHMSTVLLAPAALYFVLAGRRKELLQVPTVAFSLVFLLIGFSVYLFIPMRSHLPAPFDYPQLHGVDAGTITGFSWLMTGKIVEADMFQYSLADLDEQITFYLIKLLRDFLYVGFALGLYGALVQLHRDRRIFFFFLLAFLTYAGFFVDYGVVDQHVFFIPSFLLWAIWIGSGLSGLSEKLSPQDDRRSWKRAASYCFPGALILLVVLSYSKGSLILDFRDNRGPDEYAREILDHVEENACVSTIYEVTPLLWYHHYIGGMKPGIRIMDRGLLSLDTRQEVMRNGASRSAVFENIVGDRFKKRLEDLMGQEVGKRPCYTVKYESFLCDRFTLEEVNRSLYRVRRKDTIFHPTATVSDVAYPGSYRYGDVIELLGVDVDRERLVEGELFRVKILWSPMRRMDDSCKVLFRFVREGALSGMVEDHELRENSFLWIFTLGGGRALPNELAAGRTVLDEFDCLVPPETRGGEYRFSLALVDEESFLSTPKEELPLQFIEVGGIHVEENPEIAHHWE